MVCRYTGAVMRACCCTPPVDTRSAPATESAPSSMLASSCCCDFVTTDLVTSSATVVESWNSGASTDLSVVSTAPPVQALAPPRWWAPESRGWARGPAQLRVTVPLYILKRHLLL